jgi:hypothetical protein
MKTIYKLKGHPFDVDTYQKTCKTHVWGRIANSSDARLYQSEGAAVKNPQLEKLEDGTYKAVARGVTYDINLLVGTDEWWEAIESGKILNGTYFGIIRRVAKPIKSSQTIHALNDGIDTRWGMKYHEDLAKSEGKLIKINYVRGISFDDVQGATERKFITKIEIEE